MMMKKTLSSLKESAVSSFASKFALGADDIVESSVKIANELSDSGVSLNSLKNISNPKFLGPTQKEYGAYKSFANRMQQQADASFIGAGRYSDDVVKNVTDAINPNFKGKKAFDEAIINHQQDLFNAETYSLKNTNKDGIGIWGKAKKHPVIATSAVMGTAWGISELTEE